MDAQRIVLAIGLGMMIGVGCGDDDGGAAGGPAKSELVRQLEAVGVGRYLGQTVVPQAVAEDGGWFRYDYDSTAADGPTCIFGTPYKAYVRPGDSDRVLFYLEGGGGCWNEETCFGDSQFGAKLTSDPIVGLSTLNGLPGVFAVDDASNPFSGWTVIYVPYCDGSVFSGDNVVDFDLGRVHHRGQVNLSAAVDIMQDNYPDPTTIVVAGSSAGGYGTFSGYGVMRVAYPETEMFILNDSGPGLQNNDDPQAIDDRRENWRFEQFIVEGCTDCADQPAFLTDWALSNDPNVTSALFSYLNDFVISGFLGLDGDAYRDLLLDVTDEIQRRHPNRFKRYLIPGEAHTILLGGGLGPNGPVLDFDRVEVEGIGLRAWLSDFLTDGPFWLDLVDAGEEFVEVGEDGQLTFPNGGDPQRGSVDIDVTPIIDGNDPADATILGIGGSGDGGAAVQLMKNGHFLRFIVRDDNGAETEIEYDIRDWSAGASRRITATWEDGVTNLYIDGRRVGTNTYPGRVNVGGEPIRVGGGGGYTGFDGRIGTGAL